MAQVVGDVLGGVVERRARQLEAEIPLARPNVIHLFKDGPEPVSRRVFEENAPVVLAELKKDVPDW